MSQCDIFCHGPLLKSETDREVTRREENLKRHRFREQPPTSKSHPFPTITMKTVKNFTQSEIDEIIDFSLELGHACWEVYHRSKRGFVRIFMLPSNEVRQRAYELFQFGFCARMLCPATPPIEVVWEDFLRSQKGKIVLAGAAYPDTPKVILDYAGEFFVEGFQAGAIAVQEIFKP